MAIVRLVVVAHRECPAPSDVMLVPDASDAEPTAFTMFRERPGPPDSWPGHNAVGRAFVAATRYESTK